MTIISITASKEVRIRESAEQVVATYCQNYNGESDVIEQKIFANLKNALRWANKLSLQN